MDIWPQILKIKGNKIAQTMNSISEQTSQFYDKDQSIIILLILKYFNIC